MAGLGYKLFASGEVLTAANLQGYAVDQSVMKFATTAARTAALSTPSQGMLSWIDATGSVEQYYELYNASTNVGGAKTAGWYPANGQALFFGTASRTAATGTAYSVGASGFAFTELVDPYAWHDASTNPDRVTPNREGLYRVSCYLGLSGSGAGGQTKAVNKNGTTYMSFGGANSNYGAPALASNLVYMNGSTDYLTFTVTQDSGGNMTATAYVSVEYVRPSSV